MKKETVFGVTAVYKKVPEGYIGYVEEITGVNTQGSTLSETKINLKEALKLIIESNRKLAEKECKLPSTIFRLPNGEIKTGDDIDEKRLPPKTIVLFRK